MPSTNIVRPVAGPPRPYRFPAFTRTHLPNGVGVVSAAVSKLPLVTILAVLDAGATREPAGQDGIATLTGKLLLEGTEAHDGEALAEAFEGLGATADVSVGWDATVVQVTVLQKQVAAAMALLAEVVRTPAFRDRDVERTQAARLAARLQIAADPGALADELFSGFLYTPGSRYCLPEGGSTRSLRGTTAADIRAFHAARYVPGRLAIVTAGDLSPDVAMKLVEQNFGDWVGQPGQDPDFHDTEASGTRRIQVIPKPDVSQTELRIGHRGPRRGDRDYFEFVVMNAVLGGLFSSRINLNLRERNGYTYGAHSGVEWRRRHGPFTISTAVESAATAPAVREVVKEVERIREEAIGEEELSLATSYLAGVFPIRYETTAAIASALMTMVVHGYPADYFDTYRQRISAVSTAAVLDVAQRHLRPESLLILAVGDAGAITESLAALTLGPVTATGTTNGDGPE